jgi:carbon-monoxide dehydrogenase small subunit
MQQVSLIVNSFERTVLVETHETLLYTLRERFNLVGTKQGCDQGSCGSCTVILDGRPVLACLTPTLRCEGRRVQTIEGVAANGQLHSVQRQLVEHGAIQCGYCTPGIVMTAIPFLERQPTPTEDDIREALSGNLCRCTGYTKIVSAIRAAAEEKQG